MVVAKPERPWNSKFSVPSVTLRVSWINSSPGRSWPAIPQETLTSGLDRRGEPDHLVYAYLRAAAPMRSTVMSSLPTRFQKR